MEEDEQKNLKVVDFCLDRGHHSILEHFQVQFLIRDVSRIVANQLVRHRIASYAQASTRYITYDNTNFKLSIFAKNQYSDKFIYHTKNIFETYKDMMGDISKNENATENIFKQISLPFTRQENFNKTIRNKNPENIINEETEINLTKGDIIWGNGEDSANAPEIDETNISSEFEENFLALTPDAMREQIRYFLPLGMCTNIFVTMNLRSIAHVLQERLCSNASPEFIYLGKLIFKELKKTNPLGPKYLDLCYPKCPCKDFGKKWKQNCTLLKERKL